MERGKRKEERKRIKKKRHLIGAKHEDRCFKGQRKREERESITRNQTNFCIPANNVGVIVTNLRR